MQLGEHLLRSAQVDHIFDNFLFNKRAELAEYIKDIRNWELDRY